MSVEEIEKGGAMKESKKKGIASRPLLRLVVIFLILLLPLQRSSDAFGQAALLGGATLGAFLNGATDTADQAVLDARNSGNAVVVETGRQTVLAVQAAQNAYADSLSMTDTTMTLQVRKTVSLITTLMNQLSSKAGITVDDAATQATLIVNSLPFARLEPTVTKVSPTYVVPKDNAASNNLELNFLGNFPSSSAEGFQPTLKVNGKSFQGTNTLTKLTFLVPQTTLFAQTASGPNKLQFATVSLLLPWQSPKFFGLSHVRREDHFDVLIGSLPASPGSITVTHVVSGSVPSYQPFCSKPNFHQCSTKDCGNNDDKNHIWSTTPDAGWHVVRNTSNIQMGSVGGDVSGPHLVSDDADRVVYWATTIHHGLRGGPSGYMDFSICFQETKSQATSSSSVDTVDLKWGDSKAFPYAAGTWKITFVDFTGRTSDFAGPDSSNPFIDIEDQLGNLVIKSQNPDQLRWP